MRTRHIVTLYYIACLLYGFNDILALSKHCMTKAALQTFEVSIICPNKT